MRAFIRIVGSVLGSRLGCWFTAARLIAPGVMPHALQPSIHVYK